MSSSHKTPHRQSSSTARQRPATGRVGSTVASTPTTLSFSPSYDVHGGGGRQQQPSASSSPQLPSATSSPLDLSYPQLHHMRVQRRADQAQRKLGVHRSMLARLQDKVITAASSPTSRPQSLSSNVINTTTPQSISKRRSSPQQRRDITVASPEDSHTTVHQHQRRLTPLGTSAFMSTSRRSQGLDASLCYSPTQMAMATPTPKKRPVSSHQQAKRDAYRDDISHRKQFLNFLLLLQNAPGNNSDAPINRDSGDVDMAGYSVMFPESSALLAVVPKARGVADDCRDNPPRQEGVLIVSLATGGGDGVRWDTSSSGVFGVGDAESVYTPPASSSQQQQLPYPVTIVVIQGRLLPQDMVGVSSVVSSHPTLQELHLPDTPLDPFLRRTLNDITSTNINIQYVSWQRDYHPPPRSPRDATKKTPNNTTTNAKTTTASPTPSVFIRMSDITGSPTPSSTDSDTEDDYYGTIKTNLRHNHDESSPMNRSLQHPRRSRRRRSSGGGGSVGSSSASRSQSLAAARTNNINGHPDEDDWCLTGALSESEFDLCTMSPYLGYYPPACESRRQTLNASSIHIQRRGTTTSVSLTDERLHQGAVGGRPPRSPASLTLEVSSTPAHATTLHGAHVDEGPSSRLLPWQERLKRYLRDCQPSLGPSPTKTALKWLHTLQAQLHSNRRAVARRAKRRAHEANLSSYIEHLDAICFHVFSELVVSERMLRTDITELQTAQRTHLYSLERQEGKRAHRLDQARRLLEEIEQRMEWVQGREGAFRDALAEEELSLRLSIFVDGMQPSGRSAIIATETAVRSYAKAFESSSWAHYRGLQRSRQARQQAEKDVIVAVENKDRGLIVREWVSGLRRAKEKERADAEDVALRPIHNTLVEIALTRPPPS